MSWWQDNRMRAEVQPQLADCTAYASRAHLGGCYPNHVCVCGRSYFEMRDMEGNAHLVSNRSRDSMYPIFTPRRNDAPNYECRR